MSFLLDLLKLPLFVLLEVFYFIFRCRPKKDIINQDILITGAGQGIGKEFARQFAAMGNTVHCVDIEEKLVQNVVEDLKRKGHQAYSYTCDLTKYEQVQKLYDDIAGAGFVINILINNAGVAFGRYIHEMTLTQIQHSIIINSVAPLWLIKLFLPKMIELNEGHVVNMASLGGLFVLRRSTDYCSAKAGSIHAMNQLRLDHIWTNIKFTAICPFFVTTKLTAGLEVNKCIQMTPETMVTKAIRAIRENKETLLLPGWFKILKIIMDFTPSYLLTSLFKGSYRPSNNVNFEGQRMSDKIK